MRKGITAVALVALVGAAFLISPMVFARRSNESFAISLNGKLSKPVVKAGDIVKAGDTLALLDTTAYEGELKNLEAELDGLQSNLQASVEPTVEDLPGISGVLPASVSQVETVRVPVRVADKTKQKLEPVATTKTKREDSKKAKEALDLAQQELTASITASLDAKAAQADLSKQVAEAETTAADAAKRLEKMTALLSEGVVPEKRVRELRDLKAQADKNLADLKALLDEQDAKITASADQQAKAQAKVDEANRRLAQAEAQPLATITKKPKAASEPEVRYETKIVTRRMPLVVKPLEDQAVPVQVVVDEKSMHQSDKRIKDIEARIAELHRLIERAAVLSPLAGKVIRVTSTAIWLEPSSR